MVFAKFLLFCMPFSVCRAGCQWIIFVLETTSTLDSLASKDAEMINWSGMAGQLSICGWVSGSLAQRLCCCRLLFSSSVFLSLFIFSDPSSSMEMGEVNGFDDGLRRRNVPSFEAPRPRTSDEEDDEEEVEFKMAEKKEDKPWFSMNKCIVAALVLLFLGSLFLSGEFLFCAAIRRWFCFLKLFAANNCQFTDVQS